MAYNPYRPAGPGTYFRVGKEPGKPYFEIHDMAEFVREHPHNNLTPEQALEAFMEGIAVEQKKKPYVKYLEYSERYMMTWAGENFWRCLNLGQYARVSDPLIAEDPDDDDFEIRLAAYKASLQK